MKSFSIGVVEAIVLLFLAGSAVLIPLAQASTVSGIISVTPTTIPANASATISWTGQNITFCSISGPTIGTINITGTSCNKPVGPINTGIITKPGVYTYVFKYSGTGGTGTQSATLTVSSYGTGSIMATPTTTPTGHSAALTWSGQNVPYCTISGDTIPVFSITGTNCNTPVGPINTGVFSAPGTYNYYYVYPTDTKGGVATSSTQVVVPALSCTFNGQAVPSGQSVTAYQSSSVPAGQSCISQQRTCTNGALSGSYTNSSCVVSSIPSSADSIVSFSIGSSTGVISGTSISITLPAGTAISSLTPSIGVSAYAGVSPASGAAQDFSKPVPYTVTAQNGTTTQTYTITVTLQTPVGPTVAQLSSTNPMSWLLKSVCTDAGNRVLAVDPFGGCPLGTSIRKIAAGDPLPYYNIDQKGIQQHDSYPVFSQGDAQTFVVAPFDYKPFNIFNLFDSSDGYDLYGVQNGWVTAFGTSDGGGYGQTFFGSGCTIGNGWDFFPSSGFLTAGQTTVPISDGYWEQSAQSFPGGCPSGYSNTTLTSWQFQSGFAFGGIGGNPTKTMDTMISFHGFQTGPSFIANGHLEVFYFTKEYGVTRWEVWIPVQQNPTITTACNVPATETYQGVTFVVQSCHDWSVVTPASSPQIPLWPIPNLNLLQHAHFDPSFGSSWARVGTSSTGALINWGSKISTSTRDTAATPTGVAYLATNCAAATGGVCPGPQVQQIYQDVPMGSLTTGQNYGYGINARTQSGSGTLQVTLQELDSKGAVLWSDNVQGTVTADNGTAPGPGESSSVYLSTAFISKTVVIPSNPSAVKVRFSFTPTTPQTFNILDTWFGPWPSPSQGFGTL